MYLSQIGDVRVSEKFLWTGVALVLGAANFLGGDRFFVTFGEISLTVGVILAWLNK